LATDLNSSPAKCAEAPTPPEPYESLPGAALAAAMMSWGDLNFDAAGTTSTLGISATDATGVKSLTGSKPVFLYRCGFATFVELVASNNV
jgi:hypothetical protein